MVFAPKETLEVLSEKEREERCGRKSERCEQEKAVSACVLEGELRKMSEGVSDQGKKDRGGRMRC